MHRADVLSTEAGARRCAFALIGQLTVRHNANAAATALVARANDMNNMWG